MEYGRVLIALDLEGNSSTLQRNSWTWVKELPSAEGQLSVLTGRLDWPAAWLQACAVCPSSLRNLSLWRFGRVETYSCPALGDPCRINFIAEGYTKLRKL